MKPIIYVAHPVTGDPRGNALSTIKWVGHFVNIDQSRIYIAPWVPEVLAFDNVIVDPNFYRRVLDDDIEVVTRSCAGLIGIGLSWSGGMLQERAAARALHMPIVDATGLTFAEVSKEFLDTQWAKQLTANRTAMVEPY